MSTMLLFTENASDVIHIWLPTERPHLAILFPLKGDRFSGNQTPNPISCTDELPDYLNSYCVKHGLWGPQILIGLPFPRGYGS